MTTQPTTPPHGPARRDEIVPLRGPCIHPARSSGQADVYAMTGPWEGWLLKDFARRPALMRFFVNRRALAREARALDGLDELAGAPRLGARVDADAIIIRRLDAERLPHRRDNFLTPDFFLRLENLVASMHARGWAHGDLRRKNILVNRETLEPALIDFATACCGGPGAGILERWVFRRLVRVDRITVAKLKQAYLPDCLDDRDRRALADVPWHMRLGRFIRKKIYRPLKKRHRRELWNRIRRRFK